MTTLFLKDKILNLMTYQWYLTNLGKKILDLIEKYLGLNIICYDNTILKLGSIKSKDRAWQPHHDSKDRVKTYIWLSKFSENTHPLYYMRKTNNDFMYLKKKTQIYFLNFMREKWIKYLEI